MARFVGFWAERRRKMMCNVQEDGQLVFRWKGKPAATVETYRNPFHGENCYIRLHLLGTDFPPGELFSLLRREAACPLQIMTPPTDAIVPVLLAGGFQLRRRCYEMEVTEACLREPLQEELPLVFCEKGTDTYCACCDALYQYYSRVHQAVSPLTASKPDFFARLPEEAVCQRRDGEILHFAFLAENEIAYIGTAGLKCFSGFARSLLARQFQQFKTLYFECDSCDPAAMLLKDAFISEPSGILDTYIFL